MDGASDSVSHEISEKTCNVILPPANLDIEDEEWCHLIESNSELAKKVGLFLIDRSKDLEMILTTSVQFADEQKIRADHYKRQVKYLRESLDAQTKGYEHIEEQVEELTKSYQEINENCRYYKKKNQSLWDSVEILERKCEDYLAEIDILTTQQKCVTCKNSSVFSDIFPCLGTHMHPLNDEEENLLHECDVISLRAFSEETVRKLELERSQRLMVQRKLQKLTEDNKDLDNQILWLEHQLAAHRISKSDMSPGELTHTDKLTKATSMLALNRGIDTSWSNTNDEGHMLGPPVSKDLAAVERNRFRFILKEHLTDYSNGTNKDTSDVEGQEIMTDEEAHLTENTVVRVPSTICYSCGQMKQNLKSELNSARNDSNDESRTGTTLASYHQMFAQIFEKLKKSREFIGKNGDTTG